MINIGQLRTYIIQPALKAMGDYSPDIEEMLIAICAQETQGGTYLKQIHGPALGIYQMEPGTHDSIWLNQLSNSYPSTLHGATTHRVLNNIGEKIISACQYSVLYHPSAEMMIYNLWYATMMARAFWLDVHEPIPNKDDLASIWLQYKKYWNTPAGEATKQEFFNNYHRFTSE